MENSLGVKFGCLSVLACPTHAAGYGTWQSQRYRL